ncbi:prepilin peptidase [Vibrio astriarenae]
MLSLSIYVCISDITNRLISNSIVYAILTISLCIGKLEYINNFKSIVLIVISLAFFFTRYIGGGDAKLIISYLPLIKEDYIFAYVNLTLLSGGVVVICLCVYETLFDRDILKEQGVPYGVAIVSGALVSSIASL